MHTASSLGARRVRALATWLFTAGLLASGAAQATTRVVNSTADTTVGNCSPTCTLRDAVSLSAAGDTVNFSTLFNTPQTITLTGGEILVNHSGGTLTITGPGAANLVTVSGNNVSRIFRVSSGTTLALNGVTLRDGQAGDVGGAIVSDGSLNLSYCVVTGSSTAAGFTGGGVYEAGGTANFYACTFDNNRAGTGAGVEVINASATFANCTLSGNAATTTGGAISFRPFTGLQTLSVLNTTIAYNRSPAIGGILMDTSTAAAGVTVGNTLFGNNVGSSLGKSGAFAAVVTSNGFNLASDDASAFLVQPTDLQNKDPKLGPLALNGGSTPTHALLGGSPALDQGNDLGYSADQRSLNRQFAIAGLVAPATGDHSDIGAVEMHATIVTTTASSGAGSLNAAITATNANGTGLDDIIFASPLFDTPQTINLALALPNISGSVAINGPAANLLTVQRDYAAPSPFGIFDIQVTGQNIAIAGMTISNGNNVDTNFGGGINSLSDLNLTDVNVTGNRAPSAGGGVNLFTANGTFSNSTFSNNTAAQGGGINFQGDGGHVLRLINSTISNNAAPGASGGGIESVCANANCTLAVVNSTIASNVAVGSGGIGTSAQGGNAFTTLRNSIVAGNFPNDLVSGVASGTASVISLGFNLSSDGGGGFLNAATDQINTNPKLGPLSLGGGTTPTHALLGGSPALDKGHSSGRTTDQRGATRAFDVASIAAATGGDNADIGAVEMQAIIVTNNQSSGPGSLNAAIAAANANGIGLDDILFATPPFDTAQTIDLTTALPDITGNITINGSAANLLTVQRDSAAAAFRIFYIDSGLNIAFTGMTISNGNGDPFGGGILSFSNLTLSNINVTGNQATAGGGVTLSGSDGTFSGSTFSNNVAGSQGGGIDYESNSGHRLSLTNSTISGNTVNGPGNGGGIFHVCFSAACTLTVVNSTIVDNIAPAGGDGGVLTGASGGNATTTLRNSIIANNSPNNLSALVFSGIATVTSLGFNLASDNGGGFLTASGDQTGADPRLGPLSLNAGTVPTHALLGGSPALDKGNSSGQTHDQRGAGRPFDITTIAAPTGGDNADIGAVEMQAITVSNTLAEGTGNCNGISCTLHQAINTANSNAGRFNDIIFASPLFDSTQVIDLTLALPDIANNVSINGPGADLLNVTRDNSASNFPIFRIPGLGHEVAINSMTISNGHNAIESGGGVETYSDLTLANVYVTGNYALQFGGGVAMNAGNGTFTGSTFTNNYAANYGGGLYIGGGLSNYVLQLSASTVSGNSTVNGGGGIAVIPQAAGIATILNVTNSTIVDNAPGGVETNAVGGIAITALRNSIVANNQTTNFHNAGASAFVVSLGFNVSDTWNGVPTLGTDITAPARFAPLGYYGGETPTHALLSGSPALDAGDSSGATTDQRGLGFLRPFNLGLFGSPPSDAADIGAWEAQSNDILFINGFDND